jgi:hypothetical protein
MNHPSEIPIVQFREPIESDVNYDYFFGRFGPHSTSPVFLRYNNQPINLFNLYRGETVLLIGRGPSLGKHLENEKVRKLMMHPAITRFTMNDGADVLDNNVHLWCCADSPTKFNPSIMRNPNIMKFLPLHRFHYLRRDVTDNNQSKLLIQNKSKDQIPFCANTIGVESFLIVEDKRINFAEAYLASSAVLFGEYKSHKSVFLLALKICLLLGFSRIILLGVDFKMTLNNPYYKMDNGGYNKFHVDHNNTLYQFLSKRLSGIYDLLVNNKSDYQTNIFTATPIDAMSFIPSINLEEELVKIVKNKT